MANCKHDNKLQLLLIDDEEVILKVTAEALHSLGHNVRTAQDCETGLAIWKSNPIDAVMCDFELPDNCGLQFGEYIKNHCESLGIEKTAFILLTGWADTLTDNIAMENAGVDAIIAKPVELETLQETIMATCRPKENNRLIHCSGDKTSISQLNS
jgi:response regulator RpfG family c-di-GMP phosphodiesterase